MKAFIIGDDFTATSEQHMRDLAAAYRVCMSMEDGEQVARRELGSDYNTAKLLYELMFE